MRLPGRDNRGAGRRARTRDRRRASEPSRSARGRSPPPPREAAGRLRRARNSASGGRPARSHQRARKSVRSPCTRKTPPKERRLVSIGKGVWETGRISVATRTRKRSPIAAPFRSGVGKRSTAKRPRASATARIATRSGSPAPKRSAGVEGLHVRTINETAASAVNPASGAGPSRRRRGERPYRGRGAARPAPRGARLRGGPRSRG